MRVVYLLNVFPKISETFILNEMLAMQDKGVSIEVYAYKDEREGVVHPGVRKIKEVRYFYKVRVWGMLHAHLYWILRRPLNYLKAWQLVLTHGELIRKNFLVQLFDTVLVDRRRPDHVHAHFGSDSSNTAMVYSVLSGVPYTFTTHMQDIFSFPAPNFPIKSKLAKKHVTISEYNRKHLIEALGVRPEDVSVIHCGVDLTTIPKDAVFDAASRLIFCVARLHTDKSLDVLLEALKRLKDRGVDFACKIAGEGEERSKLEAMVRDLGLTGLVTLLGNQTQEQVYALFRQSRIKVLSSGIEGIPVSLMEALAFKVPVVATRISGIPELIEDGKSGFLVPFKDADALADRIRKLLEDAALSRAFAERGRQKIEDQFDLRKETDKLLDLWKDKRVA